MPIFQADIDHDVCSGSPLPHHAASRSPPPPSLSQLSGQDFRPEPFDGRPPDRLRRPSTPSAHAPSGVTNRAELIARIKRARSPAWDRIAQLGSVRPDPLSPGHDSPSQALLPPAPIAADNDASAPSLDDSRRREGLAIDRPLSALHAGDFTHGVVSSKGPAEDRPRRCSLTVEQSRLATSPPRYCLPLHSYRSFSAAEQTCGSRPNFSPSSTSLSSTFTYQPPTSPLVRSVSNLEPDFSDPSCPFQDAFDHHGDRCHSFACSESSFSVPSSYSTKALWDPGHRPSAAFPYQAHQPRRSLTSTSGHPRLAASPQTPSFLRSRRTSFGSDVSPIQHASMVGSYEESILRGRMSTTPSRPLDFIAQIAVLGKGKCKSTLFCPPHVMLPFHAVYYSYSNVSHGRSQVDDGPSPYVGQIDLENGLPNAQAEGRSRYKIRRRVLDQDPCDNKSNAPVASEQPGEPSGRRKGLRRSASPRAPPGGSYRIPEKGQVQIVIKNQNKTAVKLFLVPYDLSGMQAGTKTFVRQRSYSTGPIIENPSRLDIDEHGSSRPVLRYLVHLHICCPSKGRFYLYKCIRVVFANRVPEGKERLRNETTWPEPRFSPYKPVRVMHPSPSQPHESAATPAAERAFRRRSTGVSAETKTSLGFPLPPHHRDSTVTDLSSGTASGNTLPVDPIPFRLPPRSGRDSDTDMSSIPDWRSSNSSSQASRSSTKSLCEPSRSAGVARYEKLAKGDAGYGGYGGNASHGLVDAHPHGGAEGLLSQRLRSLGVKNKHAPETSSQPPGP